MDEQLYVLLSSFREVWKAIRRILRAYAEDAGLTTVQFLILEVLTTRDNVSVTELAEQLQITTGPISTTVDQLVKMGMVDRDRSDTDRRIVKLNLTVKGRALIEQLVFPSSGVLRHLRQMDLSNEEIDQLLSIHKKILSTLSYREDEKA